MTAQQLQSSAEARSNSSLRMKHAMQGAYLQVCKLGSGVLDLLGGDAHGKHDLHHISCAIKDVVTGHFLLQALHTCRLVLKYVHCFTAHTPRS